MGILRKKISFSLTIIVEPDEDRFYAYCPFLKGLHVEGVSQEDAVKNVTDAAIAYLKSLMKHGDPIPLGVMIREEEIRTVPSLTPTSPKCIHQIPVYV